MAEKEGFEPSKPFWGLHDFQSCALDQARRLLHMLFAVKIPTKMLNDCIIFIWLCQLDCVFHDIIERFNPERLGRNGNESKNDS